MRAVDCDVAIQCCRGESKTLEKSPQNTPSSADGSAFRPSYSTSHVREQSDRFKRANENKIVPVVSGVINHVRFTPGTIKPEDDLGSTMVCTVELAKAITPSPGPTNDSLSPK